MSLSIRERVLYRDDGGYEIDLYLRDEDADDQRPIAHLIVHEVKGTKLFRKLEFSLSTRVDDRVRKSWWNMALTRATARILRR